MAAFTFATAAAPAARPDRLPRQEAGQVAPAIEGVLS
jgi:hypothetical protein